MKSSALPFVKNFQNHSQNSNNKNRVQRLLLLFLLLVVICILIFWKLIYPYHHGTTNDNNNQAMVHKKSSNSGKKRKVYLHIGPHKTGSTHIHTYLDKISEKLGDYDFCWPVPRGNIQNSNLLAIHFISNRTILPASVEWVHNCTRKAKHLIISAESFDRFTVENFQEFRNFLPDFDFQVIIIYREWLNHMYSLYTEIHKYASRSTPFSEYIFKNFDFLDEIQILNVTRLVSTFSSVIGIENIHLLDYYGIMAAGKDEAYVIVCEIMGIMCEESKYLNSLTVHENEKPDMISTELFQIVRNYGYYHGCKLRNENREFIQTFVKSYRSIAITHNLSVSINPSSSSSGYHHNPNDLINTSLPISYSNLKLLHSIAKLLDQKCRVEFSKILWYGNRSANIIAIQNLNITEINKVSFYSSNECNQWLQNEIYHQVYHEKRFINCTKEIMNPMTMNQNTRQQILQSPSALYSPEERKEKIREIRNSMASTTTTPSSSVERKEYELKRNLTDKILELRKRVSQSIGVSIK